MDKTKAATGPSMARGPRLGPIGDERSGVGLLFLAKTNEHSE
ncbi:MAG: hypothetical protein AABY62_03980 [Pseudomonadota bacterium]